MLLQLVERVCTLIGAAGSGMLLVGKKTFLQPQLLASLASGPSHSGPERRHLARHALQGIDGMQPSFSLDTNKFHTLRVLQHRGRA
jgi:hypothetical protein